MAGVLQKFPHSEIMPFAITWVDLEMTTLSEVSQRKTILYIAYMWTQK